MRTVNFFTIIIMMLSLQFTTHLQAEEFECGATWEPQISFSASSMKTNSDGTVIVDPPHLQNWLRENLPNTESGTVVVHNIRFVPEEKNTLVYIRTLLTENFNFSGKIHISMQIARVSDRGQGVIFFTKELEARSINDLDSFRAPLQHIINTLQPMLAKELAPKKIKYAIKSGKVQRNPDAPKLEIEIKEIHDKYGSIGLDGEGQKLYCFSNRIRGDSFMYYGKPSLKSDQETIRKTFSIDIDEQIFSSSCFKEIFGCRRPQAAIDSKVTKIFGVPLTSSLEVIDSESEKVTIACPVKIEKEAETIYLSPEEEKKIRFRALDHKNQPVYGLWLDDMTLTPANLGTLNFRKDVTRDDGYTALTKIKAAKTDKEIKGELTLEVCEDTSDNLLGLDENNRPVYWNIKVAQKLVVSELPQVEVEVFSEQKLTRLNDMKLKRREEERQEYASVVTDQTLHLKLNAKFNKREVNPSFKDESGLVGKLIEYSGEGEVVLSAKTTTPSTLLDFKRGWFDTQNCGRQSYNYRSQEISHNFVFPRSPVKVLVYYRHYIPSDNSPVKTHPLQGLSFQEQNFMNPAIKYKLQGYYQDDEFDFDSCQMNIYKNPVPAVFATPMQLSTYFPMTILTYLDDSLGFEEVTVPLKEKYMHRFLRKLGPDGMNFDSLNISKIINLSRDDVASDWEIPKDTSERKYDPAINVANGKFTVQSKAKIIRGKFNLTP